MHLTLEVLKARKGDCLILHYGTSPADQHMMLIDGGPDGVYEPYLKSRLTKIRTKWGDEKPLPIEVIMVSHIDDDHIQGIVDLTTELLGGLPDLRLRVGSLWHNSFDDLLRTIPDELVAEASVSTEASANGDPHAVLASVARERLSNENEDIENDTDAHQASLVLAGVKQGRTLRDDAEKLGWKINGQFKGKLIIADPARDPVMLNGCLAVQIVGPAQKELQKLQAEHDAWLRKNKGKKASAAAALAAYIDKSVPNLSSIVALAELGGATVLLTGDARGDKILEGLEAAELFDQEGILEVDILKVPHHGSFANIELDFFERIKAKHYVFSGNGQHGNPERKTLELLLQARQDEQYCVHLTYPLDEIDRDREKDWKTEQKKEQGRNAKRIREGKPAKPVREDWDASKHSLDHFFASHPSFAAKVKVVPDTGRHLINLVGSVTY